MYLEFDEIKDGDQFEELVVAYFKEEQNKKNDIVDIDIKPSGLGVDGGRDILISFKVSDSIHSFTRRWVIQCKFHNRNISTKAISDVNIPSLIHSYEAAGYLLICRKKPTSKLTNLMEKLEQSCKFDYKYQIWSGEQFKHSILSSPDNILKQFFPKYYRYSKSIGV